MILHIDDIQFKTVLPGLSNTRPLTQTSEINFSMPDELRILINDCIAQSRSAQKKLYDRFSPVAYGIIKRYIYHDDGAAQEILNDSFFKIFTKLGQYSFQGAFEGWIRRIVVNTVTDHLKKNVMIKPMNKEVSQDDVHIESGSVEQMSYKELLQMVQTLPDVQRLVFNLYVFENYSHREIGTVLKISENNSRWHLNDARKRLKDKLKIMK